MAFNFFKQKEVITDDKNNNNNNSKDVIDDFEQFVNNNANNDQIFNGSDKSINMNGQFNSSFTPSFNESIENTPNEQIFPNIENPYKTNNNSSIVNNQVQNNTPIEPTISTNIPNNTQQNETPVITNFNPYQNNNTETYKVDNNKKEEEFVMPDITQYKNNYNPIINELQNSNNNIQNSQDINTVLSNIMGQKQQGSVDVQDNSDNINGNNTPTWNNNFSNMNLNPQAETKEQVSSPQAMPDVEPGYKRCPKCGQKIREDYKQCFVCGTMF